ncbi:MAG: hypothetical protein AB1715_01585, partial [Acidobacteriota bacterium]
MLFFSAIALTVFGGGISLKSVASDDRPQKSASPSRDKTTQSKNREIAPRRKSWATEAGTGRQTWARVFGGHLGYGGANYVQQTRDGGYIIAGQLSFYSGLTGMDAWLIKLTAAGKIEWQRAYGGNGVDWASEVQQTDDGGYICAGYTSPGGFSERDFWVWKVDS